MVNVIARAANILTCLSQGLNGVAEISEKLGLSKATVHRILTSLEHSGFVTQEPISRKYYLGEVIIRLSSTAATAHQGLVACAFDEMWRLRDLTGESVALQIRSGTQRLVLEELESHQSHRFTLGRGFMAPLYTGSGGYVMLSQLPASEVRSLVDRWDYVKMGPNTVRNGAELLAEIEQAREKGYAVSDATGQGGTAGISVAIHNYFCPAALSVFGPESRLPMMMQHVEKIKEASDRISRKLHIFTHGENGAGDDAESVLGMELVRGASS